MVVFDFGVLPEGNPYLVMELLRGTTLAEAIQQGRLDALRACQIAAQVAGALATVHEQGIIHRDLKPENVFPPPPGTQPDLIKIVDFGIAKQTQSGADQRPGLTQVGISLGTPFYMSPEQATNHPLDGRSDQYALGCVLYEMLTGSVPFTGLSAPAVLARHITVPPEPPRQRIPELPISDALEALVLRLLAKDREQRFPSMQEAGRALEAEIEWLLVQRGTKRVISVAAAARLTGQHPKGAVVVGGRVVPRWAIAALLGVLVLAGGSWGCGCAAGPGPGTSSGCGRGSSAPFASRRCRP